MNGLVRYIVSTFVQSQRYLPPVLTLLALLAIFTSSDSGPLTEVYAVSGGVLFAMTTWFTVALANTLGPVSRQIAMTAAARNRDVLTATVVTALLGDVLLIAIGLGYPIMSGNHVITGAAILVGAEALTACALTGNAIGILCARPLIGRQGYSVVAALGAMVLVFLLKHVPPVDPALIMLNSTRPIKSLIGPTAALAASALALLTAATAVTHRIALHRD